MQSQADVILRCLLYSLLAVHLASSTRADAFASCVESGGDATAECTVGPDDRHIPCEHEWTSLTLKPRHSGQLSATVPLLRQCRRITKLTFENVPPQWMSSSFLAHTKVASLTVIDSPSLTEIKDDSFWPCPRQLHSVRIHKSGLQNQLAINVFRQCPIEYLWLDANNLTGLKVDEFFSLWTLKFLSLAKNRLQGSLERALGWLSEGTPSVLTWTPNLEILDLSGNQLEEIWGCSWSGNCANPSLSKLVTLKLSNNRLRFLSWRSFHYLPQLQELHLDGNSALFGQNDLHNALLSLTTMTHPHLNTVLIPSSRSSTVGRELCIGKLDDDILKQVAERFCSRRNESTQHNGESSSTAKPFDELMASSTPMPVPPPAPRTTSEFLMINGNQISHFQQWIMIFIAITALVVCVIIAVTVCAIVPECRCGRDGNRQSEQENQYDNRASNELPQSNHYTAEFARADRLSPEQQTYAIIAHLAANVHGRNVAESIYSLISNSNGWGSPTSIPPQTANPSLFDLNGAPREPLPAPPQAPNRADP